MRKDILDRELDIRLWIEENRSKAFICRELNCKPSTLENYLNKLSIVYKGNKGNRGIPEFKTRKLPEDYLVENSLTKSHTINLWLRRDKIKEHKCERCSLGKWLEGFIPLELHHKDGDRHNNLLENLELLCPNCHSLTPNNSGKSNKRPSIPTAEEMVLEIIQ